MQIKKFIPEDHKIKALIYGPSGAGKTVFTGTAKNAIFASAEGGLLSIADKKPEFVEIKSLKDLIDLHAFLSNEKHSYETVVIDSITEINEVIKLEIERRTGRSMQIADWGELSKKIRDVFRRFRDLPMNVILIAQEMNDKDEDRVSKIVPSMSGKAATEIAYFMDVVGYINIEKDGSRWIETSTNKKLLTKDRSNKIGNDTPMDFSEWQKRVNGIETGKQEVVYNATPKAAPVTPSVSPESAERPHLEALKAELRKRGAKTMKEGLEIIKQAGGGDTYENLDLAESVASTIMVFLLQDDRTHQEVAPNKEAEKFQEFLDEKVEHGDIDIPKKAWTPKRPRKNLTPKK